MTAPLTLAAFIEARLAEDEAEAHHIAAVGSCEPAYRPTRVLADVEVKRRIVEEYTAGYWPDPGSDRDLTYDHDGSPTNAWTAARMIRHLAQPYADHQDFDPAWRV